jgi:hypothetical protein
MHGYSHLKRSAVILLNNGYVGLHDVRFINNKNQINKIL